MRRYNPLLPPVVVTLGLFAWIVAASMVIFALVFPAHGQECRWAHECEFVASVASAASVPAGQFRVRRHYAPRTIIFRSSNVGAKIIARDTLTAADRRLAPDMPLVWPEVEEIQSSRGGVEGHALSRSFDSTHGPAGEIDHSRHTASDAAGIKPGPRETPWSHTDRGKLSILSVFLACVLASVLGPIAAEHQKRKSHERRATAPAVAWPKNRNRRPQWWRGHRSRTRSIGALQRIAGNLARRPGAGRTSGATA